MSSKGKITSWNDEKGFGFITPLQGGNRVFVHIKAFANRARRPIVGDVVTYELSSDARGRPCAEHASIAGVRKAKTGKRSSGRLSHALAFSFLLLVAGAVAISAVPPAILLVYIVLSVVTFLAYAFDKAAARKGAWRTQESTLHLLALVGGWPGALVAQASLRHKSSKQSFRSAFWVTVVLNCAAFVWLLTPAGERSLRTVLSAIA
jgi:uncharacterized membrane protein YsdA (DUF1294 family)/cold shock CspA family protein